MEDRYFCGSCNRYQLASKGEKCVGCGKPTVTVGYVGIEKREETVKELTERWKKLYSNR